MRTVVDDINVAGTTEAGPAAAVAAAIPAAAAAAAG
jgi:hypothetical protein